MSAEDDRAPVSSEVSHPNSEPGQNAQHPPARQPPESFWGRVKRHKLVEWTLAYVAFGYALLHTVEMLGEAFEWPLLVPRLTVFGLVVGAPIAVTLAWYHGHRARQRVSGPELSILIVLLLVGGSVMWWLSRNSREHGAASATAIYAQWGNTSQALGSLESAWRLRVPELRWLKTEPLMDPLRKEPRFQAVMRELKFPE
jgi:hypothetical protein